jgi:hypothetical protein
MMLSGAGDGLGAVADREFVVDAVEIPLDGADRNEEFGPDRLVRETFGHQEMQNPQSD